MLYFLRCTVLHCAAQRVVVAIWFQLSVVTQQTQTHHTILKTKTEVTENGFTVSFFRFSFVLSYPVKIADLFEKLT